MGLLQRLLGRKFTGTIVTSRGSDLSASPSIEIEDDNLVLRMHAPDIDASTVEFDSHGGHLHVRASGTKPGGESVKLEETIRVSGGDESRALVAKEGDDLVVRMPRG